MKTLIRLKFRNSINYQIQPRFKLNDSLSKDGMKLLVSQTYETKHMAFKQTVNGLIGNEFLLKLQRC